MDGEGSRHKEWTATRLPRKRHEIRACLCARPSPCGAKPSGLPPAFQPAFFAPPPDAGQKPGGKPKGLTPLLVGRVGPLQPGVSQWSEERRPKGLTPHGRTLGNSYPGSSHAQNPPSDCRRNPGAGRVRRPRSGSAARARVRGRLHPGGYHADPGPDRLRPGSPRHGRGCRPSRYREPLAGGLDSHRVRSEAIPDPGSGLDVGREIRRGRQAARWRLQGAGSANAASAARGAVSAQGASRKQGAFRVRPGGGEEWAEAQGSRARDRCSRRPSSAGPRLGDRHGTESDALERKDRRSQGHRDFGRPHRKRPDDHGTHWRRAWKSPA